MGPVYEVDDEGNYHRVGDAVTAVDIVHTLNDITTKFTTANRTLRDAFDAVTNIINNCNFNAGSDEYVCVFTDDDDAADAAT